ncbi:kinesin-domain-containing protein [Exidia glandulosa HHB12029]|uniref:Kinesin-like protein n=1 Tax=Exidia glandulosa HHB12029 TaxID=1314781 RepID=A0A165PST8_EXIGL|nr:kinesin-domain-containing protein [Exidia glandulosa HHB12029]
MSGRTKNAPAARASARAKTTPAMPPPPTPTAPKRTTRAAAAKAATTTTTTAAATPKPSALRKPLLSRNLSQDSEKASKGARSKPPSVQTPTPRITLSASTPKPAKQQPTLSDTQHDKEPVKAYLRIRPNINAESTQDDDPATSAPYLTALSDSTVEMADPSPGSRLRPQSTRTTYTFSRVFAPDTTQSEFFTNTALPHVRSLLDGESGLLFTYGVTNSGKTYTIQGGTGTGEAGLLPRTLDVLFNSIEGLQSNAPFKPVRLNDVEYEPALDGLSDGRSSHLSVESGQPFDFATLKADQSMLSSLLADEPDTSDIDDTVLKVDRNYEYAIWISYAEVYNEKIFDLLGDQSSSSSSSGNTLAPSNSNIFSVGSFTSSSALSSLASTTDLSNPVLLKRRALTLKNDPDGGKFVAGLREVRVRTREEAKAVVKLGQVNRRVFGTLANSASSRSHGIFTVKVLRVHGGSPDDKDSVHVARLSLVDLAGSERTKNTQNTGDRLKEAGNINKSLMVLGQCMEILRANQRRIGAAAGNHSALRLAVVPFRHSKLTEIFMDFFTGGGRASMIVNVNPYDTGFDENSHVMKFSALARDVSTSVMKRLPIPAPVRRRVTVSIGGGGKGKRSTEAHLEIVEEDAETTAVEDDEPLDGLVEALFEQLQDMRVRLFEAEMRAATIEADLREEIIQEMEERMLTMSRMHSQRLMDEMADNEMKTDRKIDMLRQAGFINDGPSFKASTSRMQPRRTLQDDDDHSEDEVGTLLSETSHIEDEGESFDLGSDSEGEDVPPSDDEVSLPPPSSSPLARASKARRVTEQATPEVRIPIKRRSSASTIGLLPTDAEEDEAQLSGSEATSEGDDDDDDDEEEEDEEEEDVEAEEDDEDEEEPDKYPSSMLDDEDDEAPSWELESAGRPSGVSGYTANTEDEDGFTDSESAASPSPPPTVKKAKRVIKVESDDDELLLSPAKPVKATRASTRARGSKGK